MIAAEATTLGVGNNNGLLRFVAALSVTALSKVLSALVTNEPVAQFLMFVAPVVSDATGKSYV